MKVTRAFEHAPASVTAARRFVTSTLQDIPAETLDSVELMVSELASNCIRHADTGFEITVIETDSAIRIEASDEGEGEPHMRTPGPTEPDGRGLQIVDMLASSWGFERLRRGGKTVWFTLESQVPLPAEGGSG
jgi:anti-sigma regulatory factor (Ser/Thr protein kinase)